jgi:hypothetical protein
LVQEFLKQPQAIQTKILDDLTLDQTRAGEFFCNASSNTSSIKATTPCQWT